MRDYQGSDGSAPRKFARWFARLGDAIDQLRHGDSNKPKRLVMVQHALIDLIDLLDPDRERLDKDRERLATSYTTGPQLPEARVRW
jgi:hypothetical protein